MNGQLILEENDKYSHLYSYLINYKVKNILIVCGNNVKTLPVFNSIITQLNKLGCKIGIFSDFEPNPKYESVLCGIEQMHTLNCEAIIAIGGGSAIDVAKCMKMYCNLDISKNLLEQEIVWNSVKLLAIPTTAGTGAESTQFAVIYYNNTKYSISHESGLPDLVILDDETLNKLPEYQRKATALDVLAHSVESYWSINATNESRRLSSDAIRLFFGHYEGYVANNPDDNKKMLKAANVAGQAINIAKTTAVHAMSYKISSMYGIAHGHAVGICLPIVASYTYNNLDSIQELDKQLFYRDCMENISKVAGYKNFIDFITGIEDIIVDKLKMEIPILKNERNLEQLCYSVNLQRLINHPISLNHNELMKLYKTILNKDRRI